MDLFDADMRGGSMGRSLTSGGFSGALVDFPLRGAGGLVPDGSRIDSGEGGPIGELSISFSMEGFGIIHTSHFSTVTVSARVSARLYDVVDGGTDNLCEGL